MLRTRRPRLSLEPLEPRDVPASVLTYTDVDGDRVTIASTAGNLLGRATFSGPGAGQLQVLDLTDPAFQEASICTTVVRAPTGDGLAHIGRINATGRDLGTVAVRGDLAVIDCGDADTTTPALKLLRVRSMGRFGQATQGSGADLQSDINGPVGALVVRRDIANVTIDLAGANGNLGALSVGGSLVGGAMGGAGEIAAGGDIGPVTIGGNVQGGGGFLSGLILANGKMGSVSIGGSLVGGAGVQSGGIGVAGEVGFVRIGHDLLGGSSEFCGRVGAGGRLAGVAVGGSVVGGAGNHSGSIFSGTNMGTVTISHDVHGGSGLESGLIFCVGKLASLAVGGSLVGGSADRTGSVLAFDLGPVRIGHNLVGPSVTGSNRLFESGFIRSVHRIGSVTIGGSIIAGADDSTGILADCAAIRAGDDIGALIVRGNIVGSRGPQGDCPVVISARGQDVPGPKTDLAIGRIAVGGRVEFARFLAGYDDGLLLPVNGDAQVRAVTVGGDWVASSLVAGVMNAISGPVRGSAKTPNS